MNSKDNKGDSFFKPYIYQTMNSEVRLTSPISGYGILPYKFSKAMPYTPYICGSMPVILTLFAKYLNPREITSQNILIAFIASIGGSIANGLLQGIKHRAILNAVDEDADKSAFKTDFNELNYNEKNTYLNGKEDVRELSAPYNIHFYNWILSCTSMAVIIAGLQSSVVNTLNSAVKSFLGVKPDNCLGNQLLSNIVIGLIQARCIGSAIDINNQNNLDCKNNAKANYSNLPQQMWPYLFCHVTKWAIKYAVKSQFGWDNYGTEFVIGALANGVKRKLNHETVISPDAVGNCLIDGANDCAYKFTSTWTSLQPSGRPIIDFAKDVLAAGTIECATDLLRVKLFR